MTMTLSRRCMYAKLHVTWSKSLLYIFSLINHIDSLCIQALNSEHDSARSSSSNVASVVFIELQLLHDERYVLYDHEQEYQHIFLNW